MAVQVTLNPLPKLLHAQSRFEVDGYTYRPLGKGVHHRQAHEERYGSTDAEVGDHHLAPAAFDHGRSGPPAPDSPARLLPRDPRIVDVLRRAPKGGQADVAQADPLHRPGPFRFFNDQGNQGRADGDDGVAEFSEHFIPVSRRSRSRVGRAAGRQDDRPPGYRAAVRLHAPHTPVPDKNPPDPGLGSEHGALASRILKKGLDDIAGPVGNREDPSAVLDLGFDAVPFQQRQQIVAKEGAKRTVKKTAVPAVHADKILQRLLIGQVATRLPADQDFPPRRIHLFQQQHRYAVFGRPSGRHHAAGAGADDQHGPGIFRCIPAFSHGIIQRIGPLRAPPKKEPPYFSANRKGLKSVRLS